MTPEVSADRVPVIAVIVTDPALRALLDDVLIVEGFDTVLCPDPALAVSLARSMHPDLVVLHLSRHQQHIGAQILTAFRRDDATAALPVLLLSTEEGALTTLLDADRHPRWQVLTMPFDLDDLLATITSVLSTTRRAAPVSLVHRLTC